MRPADPSQAVGGNNVFYAGTITGTAGTGAAGDTPLVDGRAGGPTSGEFAGGTRLGATANGYIAKTTNGGTIWRTVNLFPSRKAVTVSRLHTRWAPRRASRLCHLPPPSLTAGPPRPAPPQTIWLANNQTKIKQIYSNKFPGILFAVDATSSGKHMYAVGSPATQYKKDSVTLISFNSDAVRRAAERSAGPRGPRFASSRRARLQHVIMSGSS